MICFNWSGYHQLIEERRVIAKKNTHLKVRILYTNLQANQCKTRHATPRDIERQVQTDTDPD